MKLYTKVFDGLEGMEPFEVQELREGVKLELFYMNETKYMDEFTRKGSFAVFSTKDGKVYRLLIEKGYYEVMHELYDLETNQIWEQFWCDVNKCRTNYIYKLLLPIMLVYLVVCYLMIALSNGNMLVLLVCIFSIFLITGVLNAKNKQKMQKINFEAGNKIREVKGPKHFDELSKAQERYYAKFFGYEDELKEETVEENEAIEEANEDVDSIEEAVEGNIEEVKEEK